MPKFPTWPELFGGYICVFMGDPKVCTPYCCFASKSQADNWNEEIGSRWPMLTIDEWYAQWKPKEKPDA